MNSERKLHPGDIGLPAGYHIDVFAKDLTTPINLVFSPTGEMYLADAGVSDGNGKILKRTGNEFEVIADGFTPPVTGIQYYRNNIYVSHRGCVTIVRPDGQKEDILTGLPSHGDHHNNQVVFGRDGKMYFGQGNPTNSGVVGEDNDWVSKYPFFHDYPGQSIRLVGQNFATADIRTPKAVGERAYTGAYSPFGIPSKPNEKVKGIALATGSVLRANPDGSNLELVAWGLRNPFRMKFDAKQRLYATNHGMDERGSRPIANSPDEFQLIRPGAWYGFPDYTGGMPVTLPQFQAKGRSQPSFLLTRHPMTPPVPVAIFKPHSAAMGFDLNYNPHFGPIGDVYVAEYGPGRPSPTPAPGLGHRVSKIDPRTGRIQPFAVNLSGYFATFSGDGGLERPIDVVFGLDGNMYVVDMGIGSESGGFVPKTGVIWRIWRA
ncbi:PQQ-dependent sugar dehydrogenase [Alicyclobacillus curvatus]|nr:PQQ-dependent sugar dehydrogenase [Alicyclobacillus curvatus]